MSDIKIDNPTIANVNENIICSTCNCKRPIDTSNIEKKKCSSCKCKRPIDDFKDGKKTCERCTQLVMKSYKANQEKRTKMIICECGGYFKFSSTFMHVRTKKHLRYLQWKNIKPTVDTTASTTVDTAPTES